MEMFPGTLQVKGEQVKGKVGTMNVCFLPHELKSPPPKLGPQN